MPTSSASIAQSASQSSSGSGVSQQAIVQNATISQTGGGSTNSSAPPTNAPPFHIAGGEGFHFSAPHMSAQDFNSLVRHETQVVKDVAQMTQTDFSLASHGSDQSAAALPGDVKALQMNVQAFVQVDQDIQHHASHAVLQHDYQSVLDAQHFTVPLAAGGVGATGDLINEYGQIDHLLTHDFFLA